MTKVTRRKFFAATGADKKITGTGGSGKVAVMGLLERNGKVRAKVIASANQETLHG